MPVDRLQELFCLQELFFLLKYDNQMHIDFQAEDLYTFSGRKTLFSGRVSVWVNQKSYNILETSGQNCAKHDTGTTTGRPGEYGGRKDELGQY